MTETSINQYVCFACRHTFAGQLSCPKCGCEDFALLEDETDQAFFIGSEPMLGLFFSNDRAVNAFHSDIQ